MKIIFSRKGVDSGKNSGGMASPILPCGCLCSIPIPYTASKTKYSEILFGKHTLQQICSELSPNHSHELAHLDPDLRADALASRPRNWRPAFGQSGAAARHLVNQGVCEGDLFIFFGWFRKTVKISGQLRFNPTDLHGRHIVFGWLQVGKLVDELPLPSDLLFLSNHPHVAFFDDEARPNKIYVSAESGLKAGVFSRELAGTILTKEGGYRSRWLLPEVFDSLFLERDLSYHGNEVRWNRKDDRIELQVVSRGQEFVFDGDRHPDAQKYLVDRINMALNAPQKCPHNF